MKAVVYNQLGAPSVLHIEEREKPRIKTNEVLIKVAAAGVNRTDTFQRKGHYPAPAGVVQDIPGLEVSGRIEETGSHVSEFQPGQEVCALVPGGGYAAYVAVDAGSCLPIPRGKTLQDAAAIPEALFTVWHNVFQRGGLKKGETILIYGGSGGLGALAIQLSTLYGAHVITLASSDEKAAFCRALGADEVIDYTKNDLRDVLAKDSVDVILDSVGGKYLPINIDLLREEGRLVYINAMDGQETALPIIKIMQKRLWITGSTLRSRSLLFKKQLATDVYQKAYPLLESGKFKDIIRHRFPLDEASKAHELMESRGFMGKIILIP